eukprot:2161095-Rhodomonas_salina.2
MDHNSPTRKSSMLLRVRGTCLRVVADLLKTNICTIKQYRPQPALSHWHWQLEAGVSGLGRGACQCHC